MYTILVIDAWGNAHDGYQWNDWHKIAECDSLPESETDLIALMIAKGLLDFTDDYYIEDDGYNIVFCLKENLIPLFAIEYGSVDDV